MNIKKLLSETLEFMQHGNLDQAEKNLKKILSTYPENPDALSLLGIILIHQKKFKKGKDLIRSSLLIIPNQPQAILNLGLALYQENQFDKAIQCFDQSIGYQPNYAEAYYCKALIFKKKMMFDEAIKNFNDAFDLNPNYFDPVFNLGHLYFDGRNYNQAIYAFEKSLNLDPNNLEVLNMLGNSLNEIFRYDEAINFFSRSLAINPLQEEAINGLGYSYMKKGELSKALNYYSHALKINRHSILALNNRANIYYLTQNYSSALQDLDYLLTFEKNFPNAYTTYGNILTKLRKFEKAIEKFNFSLKLDKTSCEVYQNRGAMFHEQKKYNQAIEDFNVAIELNPYYADAYNSRGASYKFVNEYKAAFRDYSRALELNPKDVEIMANIADLYYVMGDSKRSYEMSIKALEIDNNNPTVNYNFSLYLLSFKFFQKGWIHYDYRKYMSTVKGTFIGNYLTLRKNFREWQGPSEKGKLLILNEQGIGDQVFYLSLLKELQDSKLEITVLIIDKLCKVFQQSFKNINFIPTNNEFRLESLNDINFDFFILMGDLGKLLRNSLDAFKCQPPSFLISDKLETEKLKSSFYRKNKKICGLSWKSSSKYVGDAKSIELKNLSNILNISELTFLNLQYGDVDSEIDFIQSNFDIKIESVKEIDKYNDIDALISLIDSCDFIVTTSNATAHFAGALGKETFLLVPHSNGKIWYWHENDEVSIWYPSIKIFRQDKEGLWTNAINNIAENLKERLINE